MRMVWGFRRPAAAVLFFLGLLSCTAAWAGDCRDFTLTPEDHAYHIYPVHHGVCPEEGVAIRCYKYHWHWVCEKGETLYWDRRLDTAARTACGCPLPPGVAPATPAVSGKPIEGLITSDGQ